jgi:phosphate uptake regulator
MKRKVVQQGAATLMISLPAKWARAHHVTKGSEVLLKPTDGGLLVSADIMEPKTKATITLHDLTESSIRTLITNTYRKGRDIITVHYNTEKQFNFLKEVIKTRLIGFEIISKGKGVCTVENITEPSADQFETLMKKMFYNVSEMFDITQSHLKNTSGVYDFEEIEERIQRYSNFCYRVIANKRLQTTNSEFLWMFITLIVHGQRELYLLNNYLTSKIKISTEVEKFCSHAREIFELIKKAYFEKNVSLLAKVNKIEKSLLYNEGYTLLQESKKHDNVALYYLMSSIRKFYQANSPLSGLLL